MFAVERVESVREFVCNVIVLTFVALVALLDDSLLELSTFLLCPCHSFSPADTQELLSCSYELIEVPEIKFQDAKDFCIIGNCCEFVSSCFYDDRFRC